MATVATAAARDAANADELSDLVAEVLGCPLPRADRRTRRPADVRAASAPPRSRRGSRLVVDIGGGSTEVGRRRRRARRRDLARDRQRFASPRAAPVRPAPPGGAVQRHRHRPGARRRRAAQPARPRRRPPRRRHRRHRHDGRRGGDRAAGPQRRRHRGPRRRVAARVLADPGRGGGRLPHVGRRGRAGPHPQPRPAAPTGRDHRRRLCILVGLLRRLGAAVALRRLRWPTSSTACSNLSTRMAAAGTGGVPYDPASRDQAVRTTGAAAAAAADGLRGTGARCGCATRAGSTKWEPRRLRRPPRPDRATARRSPSAATPASASASSAPATGSASSSTRSFAGEINLNAIQRGPFQNAYVGYWVDEAKAGQELVPEAVVVLTRLRVRGAAPAPPADRHHPPQREAAAG